MRPVKIKTYVLDDEPIAIEILTQFISRTPILELAGASTNPQTAKDEIIDTRPDLLFLDIKMPVLTGFDVIDSLDNYKPLVVLTTAYPEYALEGFDYQVLDYLLKPIPFERFMKSVKRAEEILNNRQHPQWDRETTTNFFFKSDKGNIQIEPDDINYVQAFGDYVKVYRLSSEKHYLLLRIPLTSFQDKLRSSFIIQVHRSFLVNRNQIISLESRFITLRNQIRLPIGKTYYKTIKNIISPV